METPFYQRKKCRALCVVARARCTNETVRPKRVSVAGLCQELLHLTLDKTNEVRCSNWETRPLSAVQKAYAAADAYAALAVYQVCGHLFKHPLILLSFLCLLPCLFMHSCIYVLVSHRSYLGHQVDAALCLCCTYALPLCLGVLCASQGTEQSMPASRLCCYEVLQLCKLLRNYMHGCGCRNRLTNVSSASVCCLSTLCRSCKACLC